MASSEQKKCFVASVPIVRAKLNDGQNFPKIRSRGRRMRPDSATLEILFRQLFRSSHQCDQIGLFLKVFGHIFFH